MDCTELLANVRELMKRPDVRSEDWVSQMKTVLFQLVVNKLSGDVGTCNSICFDVTAL